MDKSPDAFRTISEVAEWLGVQTHVLRFWESKFSQVKPVKRAGGRRYYRPADMQLLGGIKKLLHDDGMTIKGVQKLLREKGTAHVAGFSAPLDRPAAAQDGVEETPVAENVVRFKARAEDSADAEEGRPEEVPVAQAEAAAENEAEPKPEIEAEDQTLADGASPLPAFLTKPMGGTPPPEAPAAPRVVDAPDPPPEAEIVADPGVLTHLAHLDRLPPDIARDITPLVSRLAVLRDQLAGQRG